MLYYFESIKIALFLLYFGGFFEEISIVVRRERVLYLNIFMLATPITHFTTL